MAARLNADWHAIHSFRRAFEMPYCGPALRMAGVTRIFVASKTLIAMILAISVYALVDYFLVVVVMIVLGFVVHANQWLIWAAETDIIRLIGLVTGSIYGMWGARLACDMALSAYRPRYVLYTLIVVIVAIATSKILFHSEQRVYLEISAQLFAAALGGYIYFWPHRSPVEVTIGPFHADRGDPLN